MPAGLKPRSHRPTGKPTLQTPEGVRGFDMPDTTPTDATAEADEPKSLIDKLGASLPVGLTALATVFAGMSTAALQQSMYWKSQAAQDQSKATNQWTLAGFKRDRSLIMEAVAAQLRAAAGYAAPKLVIPTASASDANYQKALEWLSGPGKKAGPPPARLPEPSDERIGELVKSIQAREPESKLLRLALSIKHESINKTL